MGILDFLKRFRGNTKHGAGGESLLSRLSNEGFGNMSTRDRKMMETNSVGTPVTDNIFKRYETGRSDTLTGGDRFGETGKDTTAHYSNAEAGRVKTQRDRVGF